ncbi:MAG TPA: toprim domain-containing protein, partial [Candidatus Limnocylindria bacterium]|nr:toprim domain-containing protein [Candidatus Limnocylindria bacterium]
GVELEVEDEDPQAAQRRRRRERLLELLERTAAYYVRVLWDSEEAARAREYLAGRGLAEATLRAFRVGYAPSAWDRVMTASLRAGFTEAELHAAGLGQRSRQGSPYDRFRARIMFPLADRRGRVLGFGARALRDNQQPKYLNTSDGEVYRKGRHLFGADLARAAAARAGSVVVVEGYTDVIALHQAGMDNAVGIMGTALTDEQVDELRLLAARVELALDADAAGQAAMLRAARVAARRALELRVVAMPPGTDPADLVQAEGAEAMRARVAASVPFARFRVERALARADLGSAEGRDRALGEVAPALGELPRGALRDELTRLVASRLELREAIVDDAAERAPRAAAREASAAPRPTGPRVLDRREETERRFLASCIAMPEQGREALRAIREDEHFVGDLTRRALRHLRDRLATPLSDLPEDDPELVSLISELVVVAGSEPATPAALTVRALQLEKLRLERRIAAAGEAGGLEVDELAAERELVLRRLREASG